MPKIAYIEKKFRTDSLYLIDKVNEIIEEYSAQGFSLTLRQVYYQMVTQNIIENKERSYKNLGELISNARLAGHIDWNAIKDRTRFLRKNSHWGSPANIIGSAAYSYHVDHWEGQENYVEVWIEKDALIDVVAQICEPLDVNHFSCRGFVSQSEMWEAAQRLERIAYGKHIVLIHLGDHDPSGIDMSRDIRERLELFGIDDLEFHRIALNRDQIDEYNPPPNPAKLTDSRAGGYIVKHGYDSWELDALEPRVMSDMIESYVTRYRDEGQYQKIKQREDQEKDLLNEIAENWYGIENNWEEIRDRFL